MKEHMKRLDQEFKAEYDADPDKFVCEAVRDMVKTTKVNSTSDRFNKSTDVLDIMCYNGRWPDVSPETSTEQTRRWFYAMRKLELLNQMNGNSHFHVKCRYFREVAFIDVKDPRMKQLLGNKKLTGRNKAHPRGSIVHYIWVCAVLISNNFMFGCNLLDDEMKLSIRRRFDDRDINNQYLHQCLLDFHYYGMYMNFKNAEYPIKRVDKQKEYETMLGFSLHGSIKYYEKKAKEYGVWSVEYLSKRTNDGRKVGNGENVLTKGAFYPIYCLMRRLIPDLKVPEEDSLYLVTDEQKILLLNPNLPMDKDGKVVAIFET